MSTSALLDQVTYPRAKVHAPCYGSRHQHSRAIAACNTCGRAVVIYQGRVLNVHENGYRGARKFTCWADAHHCIATDTPEAKLLSDAYYTAKEALDKATDVVCAKVKAGVTAEEHVTLFEQISDLKIEVSEAKAAANDAGLTWIGIES